MRGPGKTARAGKRAAGIGMRSAGLAPARAQADGGRGGDDARSRWDAVRGVRAWPEERGGERERGTRLMRNRAGRRMGVAV
jgi:hypothetical protein